MFFFYEAKELVKFPSPTHPENARGRAEKNTRKLLSKQMWDKP